MNKQQALTRVDGPARSGKKHPELMLRVNSALVLVSISLLAAYSGPVAFAILISVFAVAMAWEWARLIRGSGGIDEAFVLHVAGTVSAALLTAHGYIGSAFIVVLAATLGVFALRRLTHDSRAAWWSAAGVYYAGFPAIALIWLRTDPIFGWHAILFLFVIVWTTDTAAYAAGRLIGGPKLAPIISPKKTWAGLIGGIVAAAVAGSLYALILGGTDVVTLAILASILAFIAQIGDLAESALKRIFGLKDSSGLIPGHGGVLDRMDGLVVAAVASASLAWVIDPAQPGAALLIWPSL